MNLSVANSMKFKLLVLFINSFFAFGQQLGCNQDSALVTFKRPTYDFSVRILDRVAHETDTHFVFSPISTWLQLMTLAEGARGKTADEIWKATKYHRIQCFRRKFRELINVMNEELSPMTKRTSTIVIDKLLDVKESFTNEVRDKETNVLTLDFNDPASASKVNNIIRNDLNGVVDEGLGESDFNLTVLLMTDAAYFKSDWQIPFNPLYTSRELFYSEENRDVGEVRLMAQIGYYNMTYVPFINAKVLELPFNSDDRVSMLVMLPISGSVRDMYFKLKEIRFMTIFSLFKVSGPRLLTVKLPRFKIKTVLDNIPELVYDMGVKRIFNPNTADLSGISDYKMQASLITQIADIEITENGANASAGVEFLVKNPSSVEEFVADHPFAYVIVDKKTDIILFAGIYSKPSIY